MCAGGRGEVTADRNHAHTASMGRIRDYFTLLVIWGGGSDSSHALYTNDISNGAFEVLLDANYLASIEVES